MVVTAWLEPSSVVNEEFNSSYADWTSPANAASSNNGYATATVLNGGSSVSSSYYTNRLKATNPAPAVPADATITLVEVEVEAKVSATGPVTSEIVLVIGGTSGSTTPASFISSAWSTSDTAKVSTYSEAQCASLTPAIVNASGFGVAVRMGGTTGGSLASRTISVDAIRVRITYELPPATQAPRTMHQFRRRRT